MEFEEGETYLLPLGACEGDTKEAAVAGGYQLPLKCEVRSVGKHGVVTPSPLFCNRCRQSAH